MRSFAFKILFACYVILNSLTVQCREKKASNISIFNHFIPKYSKLQYAGSMGLLSAGAGWEYGKKRWETDLLVGYAPTDSYRQDLFTMTLKQNYTPWRIKTSNYFSLEPLTSGFYINAILNDKNVWGISPNRYPNGYYKHSNRFRFHVYIGQGLKYDLKKTNLPIKTMTAFYEISTFDLYLLNIVKGSYLKPDDYISLSLGLRFGF